MARNDEIFGTLCKVMINSNKKSSAKRHIATKGFQALINDWAANNVSAIWFCVNLLAVYMLTSFQQQPTIA